MKNYISFPPEIHIVVTASPKDSMKYADYIQNKYKISLAKAYTLQDVFSDYAEVELTFICNNFRHTCKVCNRLKHWKSIRKIRLEQVEIK